MAGPSRRSAIDEKPAVQLGEPGAEECARGARPLGGDARDHAREDPRDREMGRGHGQNDNAGEAHPWIVDEECLADGGELPHDDLTRSAEGLSHPVPFPSTGR
jgi:hypothetical protein